MTRMMMLMIMKTLFIMMYTDYLHKTKKYSAVVVLGGNGAGRVGCIMVVTSFICT